MRTYGRLLAALLALLLPAVLLVRVTLGLTLVGELPGELSLPPAVGDWVAVNENRLSERILSMIEPDAYVLRRYEAPGREPVWIYAALYAGRSGYGKGAHDPEVCYPAQGWEILRYGSLKVPVGGGSTLHTRVLRVHRLSAQEVVLYWFQPAARWPSTGAVEELLRVVDAATGRPQYAFVRISAPPGAGGVDDVADFARAIAPAVRAAVEGWKPAASADARRSDPPPSAGGRPLPVGSTGSPAC